MAKYFILNKMELHKYSNKSPFNFANGVGLSGNEDFLYVVCTWLSGVERIVINPDGSVDRREVYTTLP